MAPVKPEAALDKAKKMVNIGKIDSALEILIECMKAQKKQKSLTKIHEDVMMLVAELCVNSRKSLQFKEVIHQYKNMTAQVNPKSLEDVVRKFLHLAKQRTEEAREQSKQTVPDEVDDLENPETPESLILSLVNAEEEKDRQDRTILTPWLKFLWESFRQCLELLRNNARFEKMYHEIVNDAATFCMNFSRKAEFKKLSEILRSHMSKLQNNLSLVTSASQATNLTADSWGYHHETRLKQLDQALNFQLHSEAYKAVEDLWNLLNTSTVSVKSRITANYYTKTAKVFFESGSSYLFHAAALHRLFFFSKENKKTLTASELEQLATQVVIATLAIPLPTVREPIDPLLESGEITNPVKLKQLSMLLKLPSPPTRASLVKEVYNNRVHELVNSKLSHLFTILEFEYKPLALSKEAEPVLEWLNSHPEFHVYTDLIKEAIVSKVLIQIGKIYKSVKIHELENLCPFVGKLKLMSIVTNLIRNLELPIRIDYRSSVLFFDVYTDLGISQRNDTDLVSEYINNMSSLSRQLSKFAVSIYEVVDFTGHVFTTKESVRDWIRQSYSKTLHETHTQMCRRKTIIENRKEEIERYESEQTHSMNELLRMQEERRRREESVKLKEERELQQMKQMLQDKEKGEKRLLEVRLNYLNSTDAGREILKNYSTEELEKMSDVDVVKIQCERRLTMKQEELSRLKKLEIKLDYFQRALRLEEISLIESAQLDDYVIAKKLFEDFEEKRKLKSYEMYQLRLENREICMSYKDDIEKHVEDVRNEYEEEYEQRMIAYEAECERIRNEYKEKRREEMLKEEILIEKIEPKPEPEPVIIERKQGAYIPPHMRNKMRSNENQSDIRKNSPKPRQPTDEDGWRTQNKR